MTTRDVIEAIKDRGTELGECGLLARIEPEMSELANLLFCAQGVEFCVKHTFPSLPEIQVLKKTNAYPEKYGIYVDAGNVQNHGANNVALVGNTEGVLTFNDNTNVCKVVLMHGATAHITASRYVVVNIEVVGDECKWTAVNDGTASIINPTNPKRRKQ